MFAGWIFGSGVGKHSFIQGPIVESIVSLTTSLRRQFVKYMPTTFSNTLLFFVGKMCNAKDSHIFSTKNHIIFIIFMFEILMKRKLTTLLISNNWPLIGHGHSLPTANFSKAVVSY